MKNLAVLSVLTLLLSACASLSDKECTAGNWEEIGKRDALNGYRRNLLEQHQVSCEASRTTSAQELYNRGWEQGHKNYCTAENGYSAGLSGAMVTAQLVTADICDAHEYPEFAEQFKLGRKVAALHRQREEIQTQIDKNNEDRSVIANVSRGIAIWNGRSPTESLDQRRSELDEKIMAIDNNAPGGPKMLDNRASAELVQTLMTRVIPSDPNTFLDKTGAFLGTMFGFGVGHAIQGRYSESGWKWTLGEVAAFSLAVSSSDSTCSEEIRDPYTGYTHRNCVSNGKSPSIASGTTALWLGLRIWQSYDLWTYSGKNTTQAKSTLVARPDGILWIREF